VRVHLRAWPAERDDTLASAFVITAETIVPDPEGLARDLLSVGRHLERLELPFDEDTWRAFVDARVTEGLPAVHHSEGYTMRYAPAYRVVFRSLAEVAAEPESPCELFFTALENVPHVVLSMRTGAFVSTWDEMEYRGCEVDFETNDSLSEAVSVPSFDAIEDSEMYRLGWRMSEGIGADGPGSGVFGIERESVLCVVRWAQPAYLFDDGEIVQSETFSMKVQCREA
jgi:hypothetical protein